MVHTRPLHQLVSLTLDWFISLPETVQGDVKSRARQREHGDGDRIFSKGDVSDGMYQVVAGSVKVSGQTADGHEAVLDFYGPGMWFGEVSALDGLPRLHSAEAVGPTTVAQLKPADLERLLRKHPELSRSLLRLEALRLRLLLTALEQYATQTLEQRLANRLLMLALSYGKPTPDGIQLDLHLPQELLAQLIGATRQRVNQIFKEWAQAGLVDQQYGRVVILDHAKLEALCQM